MTLGGISTIQPELEAPFPPARREWVCPENGIRVPVEEGENRAWRERLLRAAEKDPVWRRDLMAACKQSPTFFANAFVWTLWEQEVDAATGGTIPAKVALHPWICWSRQEEALSFIRDCFLNGQDCLIDKSRDLGMSWLCMIFCDWLWLFRPNTQIRCMSRTEDLVDSPISKSLFYKLDTIHSFLPEWMCPPGVLVRGRESRTSLRIHNALNGSTIAGESTNRAALSGDRAALVLLDEMSKMDNGASIKRSTAAVTPCRLVNSTVDLPGSAYSEWKNSGTIKTFGIYAWHHPRKGAGRFVIQDETTKQYRITSPYIEREIQRNGWKEVATEIYAIEGQAGDTFFQLNEVEKHAALYAREPVRYGIKLKNSDKVPNADVAKLFRSRDLSKISLTRATANGDLQVWAPMASGRLDQSKSYIIGIDISKGQGGEGTSESVASIKCKQTGEIVAKWASKSTPPYEAARVIAALALWVGGAAPQRLPLIVPEANGPGWDFINVFVNELHYPYCYRSETVNQVAVKQSQKYGWHSSRDAKELLLRAYERALREGRIINRDRQSLDQAKTYICYPGGGVGPAEMSDKNKAEYMGHGDRVIADALTVMDKTVMTPKKDVTTDAKAGTWGARYQQFERSERRDKRAWRQQFDFRHG